MARGWKKTLITESGRKTTALKLRITSEEKKALEAVAVVTGISMSELMRSAIAALADAAARESGSGGCGGGMVPKVAEHHSFGTVIGGALRGWGEGRIKEIRREQARAQASLLASTK